MSYLCNMLKIGLFKSIVLLSPWIVNAMFLGQQINCVGLTVGGYGLAIVTLGRRQL